MNKKEANKLIRAHVTLPKNSLRGNWYWEIFYPANLDQVGGTSRNCLHFVSSFKEARARRKALVADLVESLIEKHK